MTLNTERVLELKFQKDRMDGSRDIKFCIDKAWDKVAPFWSLKNLIAVNPLQGFEDLPFEEAIVEAGRYFQQPNLPLNMEEVNRETIKWCQAFFDDDQATLAMPFRWRGLYGSWRQLAKWDRKLHESNVEKRQWLLQLPESAEAVLLECLQQLDIPHEERSLFLTLLLTTLPGWSSFIKYRTTWLRDNHPYPVDPADYLALRMVITYVLWPEAKNLLTWHNQNRLSHRLGTLAKIKHAEARYRSILLDELSKQAVNFKSKDKTIPLAQLIFCIDVRSEPLRRSLEAQGDYETLGFAGFFGIPVKIHNELSGDSYPSCPVLLEPQHSVQEKIIPDDNTNKKIKRRRAMLEGSKRLYQSLKYTFTVPFALVEMLGLWSGLWMLMRTLSPVKAARLKQKINEFIQPQLCLSPCLTVERGVSGISLEDQCSYAKNALVMMGLTDYFAPIVVLCGHGSHTQNNAYASALDCGACGGRPGDANARILAAILNTPIIRHRLALQGICIPSVTRFIAALHNTTTDEVLLDVDEQEKASKAIHQLQEDLKVARKECNLWRSQSFGYREKKIDHYGAMIHVKQRSEDWAQTRPEWGLARNGAFIIGPRHLTKAINLEGRAFLHSYDWQQDVDGSSLNTILTAPMIVAQWINSQYLFSTLDNVAYGSGSKITHNVTGKIGVVQGNASDLMHGLALQSVYWSDEEAYHEPTRLLTIVYAPRCLIYSIILRQPILQKLFQNGWVTLVCIEPQENQMYWLERHLDWKPYQSIVKQLA